MTQRHSLRTLVVAVVVACAFAFPLASVSYAQAGQTIQWDDYTFKFSASGQTAQVLNSEGKVVGSIRKDNGELQAFAMPGTDSAKLKKSFADWKIFNARSHSAGKPAAAAVAPPADQSASDDSDSVAAPVPVPAPKKSTAAASFSMTECEGTNNCATWTFLGKQGNGQWPSGEIANLTVERFDNDSVVIRRADSTGAAAGLTATYTGTRQGGRIGGEFTSSWPGHWNSQSGNWYATVEKTAMSLPSVIHMCIRCEEGKGGTLVWENGHYAETTNGPNGGSTYTVESFTRQSVILHRNMFGTYQGKATLTGQLSEQGNSIVNGIQRWDGSDNVHAFHMAWGSAINTVIGDYSTAQPTVVVRPAICYPWFFTIICQ